MPEHDRMLNVREVLAITSLGRTSLYCLVKEGDFPAPRQLTKRKVGWRQSEVLRWVDERAVASSGPAKERAAVHD
jgi:prophage regulatory protein